MHEKINIDYVICLPGENFSSSFLTSWSNSIVYMMQNNFSFIFCNYYTPIVSSTRNWLIKCFPGKYENENKFTTNTLPFENKINYKKIIFIDDDIVWSVEDFSKILLSDKDIVGGFYLIDNNNNNIIDFLASQKQNENMPENDIFNKTELIELKKIGFGFIGIKSGVFETIKFPWFHTETFIDKDSNITKTLSEDYYFCKKAIESGYKIYGDPTIKVKHEKLKQLKIK